MSIKTIFNIIVGIAILAGICIGVLWTRDQGYWQYQDGEFTFRLHPDNKTAATPPAPQSNPSVTLPSPEDFSFDIGGDPVFSFVEVATPQPPICSAFPDCNVDLANDYWSKLPGEQGYSIPGAPIIVAGLDIVRSVEESRSAASQWWDDNIGNTWRTIAVTGRFFARAAIRLSDLTAKVSAVGEIVTVELKTPPICLDSAAPAMSSPQPGQPWTPIELRWEETLAYDPIYDTCSSENWQICSSGVKDNSIYEDIRLDNTGMAQVGSKNLGILAASIIDESQGLRQAAGAAIIGQAVTVGEEITINTDEFGVAVPQTAHDMLVLYGQAIGCKVLSASDRPCDINNIVVTITPSPWPEHFQYCNGRDFAFTSDDVSTWMQSLTPNP